MEFFDLCVLFSDESAEFFSFCPLSGELFPAGFPLICNGNDFSLELSVLSPLVKSFLSPKELFLLCVVAGFLGFPELFKKFGVGMSGSEWFGFLFVLEPYCFGWGRASGPADVSTAFLAVRVVPIEESVGECSPGLFR